MQTSVNNSLVGKVALVTGASRGIGRACAEALSDHGVRVAVGFCKDGTGADEVARRCNEAMPVQLDVRCSDSVARAFEEIEDTWGSVQILVNSAGATRDRLLARMDEDDWLEVLDTNLSGVFRCTRRAVGPMLRSRWGRVVTVGSVVGLTGNAGQANYAAAKAGIVGFTKALARELGRHGITVNVVAPGFVDTHMTKSVSPDVRETIIRRTAVGRCGTPEEMADSVRFCVMSPYVTGQVIVVDGGIV